MFNRSLAEMTDTSTVQDTFQSRTFLRQKKMCRESQPLFLQGTHAAIVSGAKSSDHLAPEKTDATCFCYLVSRHPALAGATFFV